MLDKDQIIKPARKLRKVIKRMDDQPSPDAVHDLRTNTRRFEAILDVLSLEGQKIAPSVRKQLKECRKRAGKVRDMDVLTGFASEVHLDGEDECSVQLLEYLAIERRKSAKKLYSQVRRVRASLRKELKSAPVVLEKRLKPSRDAEGEDGLAPDMAALAAKFAVQLPFPHQLRKANLHPYRLKIKELRNILRVAAGSNSTFLDDLKNVKDAIGEWHDWEELVAVANSKLHHARCRLIPELKRRAEEKFKDAQSLAEAFRRKYLREPKPKASGSHMVPGEQVWEAISRLAA